MAKAMNVVGTLMIYFIQAHEFRRGSDPDGLEALQEKRRTCAGS